MQLKYHAIRKSDSILMYIFYKLSTWLQMYNFAIHTTHHQYVIIIYKIYIYKGLFRLSQDGSEPWKYIVYGRIHPDLNKISAFDF